MGRHANAWRYGGRGTTNGGRGNGSNQNREKDMRFATQEQMTRGYYGTYNDVKELIINNVQKKY